ncbi:MAG TPA: adenylate/guanylate cyclase domain-containing protein, partial [Spirochaetia bacterium]|nr:adenylate/guanylate cyclase domain-containing protein [Spirochaetia bacterium]
NLIAPSLYTLVELVLENPATFFAKPQHFIFWGFSLTIGVLQELRWQLRTRRTRGLLIPEDLARTGIFVALYWVLEAATRPEYRSLAGFLSDNTHLFVAVITAFFGIFLGFAQMQADGFLSVLRSTAGQLRLYSEWLLGPHILGRAFQDTAALSLKRVERSLLFMDIRGFTRWSERTDPENVVAMLNRYYGIAEEVLNRHDAVKLNFTADEVMAPFESPEDAAHAALALRPAIDDLLSHLGLSAGIGINTGPVIQGLIGSTSVKSYNVIGDAVNTAKRIESSTAGGAIMVSAATRNALGAAFNFGPEKTIEAKGKQGPVPVYDLIGPAAGERG